MAGILIKSVAKSSLLSDIQETAQRLNRFPKVLVLEGKEIKEGILKLSSSLFPQENLVLFLVDPEKETLKNLKRQLDELGKKIWIIIYETKGKGGVDVQSYTRTEREKIIRKKIISFLKQFGKTMTDKAYSLFMQKVTDDTSLENELLKLVNYVGERQEIRSKDVEAITTGFEEETLISLFETIKEMDKKTMIEVIDNLLMRGTSPLMIHAYFCRVVRLLMQGKEIVNLLDPYDSEGGFFRKFSDLKNLFSFIPEDKKNYFPYLNPRYALNIAGIANRMPFRRLKDLYNSLTAYDLNVKTGTRFERTRLETVLLRSLDV